MKYARVALFIQNVSHAYWVVCVQHMISLHGVQTPKANS